MSKGVCCRKMAENSGQTTENYLDSHREKDRVLSHGIFKWSFVHLGNTRQGLYHDLGENMKLRGVGQGKRELSSDAGPIQGIRELSSFRRKSGPPKSRHPCASGPLRPSWESEFRKESPGLVPGGYTGFRRYDGEKFPFAIGCWA